MPVIEVDQLTRRSGDKLAVDGLSFSVERGEIFGILGPTGRQDHHGRDHRGVFAIGLVLAAVAPTGRAASGIGSVLFFPTVFFAGL